MSALDAPVLDVRTSARDATRSGPMEKPPLSHSGFLESLRYLDLALVCCVLALTAFGLLMIFGTVHRAPMLQGAIDRQIMWFGVALCGLALSLVLDYRWLAKMAPVAWTVNLGLLIAVLVVGREINGAKSWFRIGPLSFQPAETMKIITVLMVAQWFALRPEGVRRLRDLAVPALLCFVPMLLVLRQPDLGTASLFGVIFLTMVFWAGVRRRILVGLFLAGILCAIGTWPVLKDYQKARIMTFVDPGRDPQGAGYNVIQSMIAVGSGGLTGQGIGQGTQGTYRYLPEAHTDFIFASTVEQTGFLGAVVLLGLYGVLVWRSASAVAHARDRFGGLMVAGLVGIVVGHSILNICMNVGLFPVTGLPLPFMSYGGSFLLSMYVITGLILNVGMRRFVFNG